MIKNRRAIPILLLAAGIFLLTTGAVTISAPKPSSKALLQKRISCDFQEASLSEVAEYLRLTTGMNVVYEPPADGVEPFITLELRDLPLQQVLYWTTALTDLGYRVSDNTVYIGPKEKVRQSGRVYFAQYDVNDVLLPLAVMGSNGGNNNDDGNDNNRTRNAANELMTLVVLFTGGTSNWDHVEVMGYGSDDDDDDSESEEDLF